MPELLKTPLHNMHRAAGACLAPFAGYEMPLRYPTGDLAEHQQARNRAALFDVSHMGQVRLVGPDADGVLEGLVPSDIRGLRPGQMRYTLFTNDDGGILDDLMAARAEDGLHLVVNAARKAHDLAHLRRHLSGAVDVVPEPDRALLALQGPAAADVLSSCSDMAFMSWREAEICGVSVRVSRSGYTGEDGFELSVAAGDAEVLAARLLAHDAVGWAGLGARDSLRLEAGLCLYGHDIDETTSPTEAGLGWTIPKRRRQERNFPGAARILDEPPARRRVGLRPEGRVIARAGHGGAGRGRRRGRPGHQRRLRPDARRTRGDGLPAGRARQTRHACRLRDSRQGPSRPSRAPALRSPQLLPHLRAPMTQDTWYTREHEWVRIEDGDAVCGITDYAQTQLGDVVYVELPEVGTQLVREAVAGVVESTKAANDVYAPVSGEVVAVNGRLEEEPNLVNESAEDRGWFFRIRLADASELEDLLNGDAYQAFVSDLD